METIDQIIEKIKPSEILVKSTNYLQCIIDDNFREFQKSYTEKKWYEFKTTGNYYNEKEIFVNWI